jgi:hypothetical protein
MATPTPIRIPGRKTFSNIPSHEDIQNTTIYVPLTHAVRRRISEELHQTW